MESKTKDPNAVLDYGFDWARWLPEGDTITTSEWFVANPDGTAFDPSAGDLHVDSDSHTTTTTVVWLSQGVLAATYLVTNRITTAAGRTNDQTMKIKMKEL